MHGLAAGNLGTAQSTGTADSDPFCPGHDATGDCLFHHPSIGNTAANLVGNYSSDQESVKFRLLNLLNV